MTTATLFGVALAPLFTALATVESNNGKTSRNVYQITEQYVDDVNRICRINGFSFVYYYSDVNDRSKSERMMETYLAHYGKVYADRTGRLPTWETLARIHNGGPDGWKKYATKRYWRRVKELLPGGAT